MRARIAVHTQLIPLSIKKPHEPETITVSNSQKGGNEGPERLSDFPKVTEREGARLGSSPAAWLLREAGAAVRL